MTRDERGAIVVMALPMALFLIGMLHYAVGIGDAIIARETMQDAADASALSAAVMMARGMNLIVLINVVMASLLAILVMLRLTQVMIGVGIALCLLLSSVTIGATASQIPALAAAEVKVQGYYVHAQKLVNPTLVALNTTATVLRHAMPAVAEARVIDTSRRYAPPAIVGFALPAQLTLPTEDGTEDQLCGEAGKYAAKLATVPIQWLLPDDVLEVIEDGLGEATRSLAAFFCSSSSTGAPPPIPIPQKRVRQELPKLPKMRDCEDFVNQTGEVDPEHQRLCDEARTETEMSQPDRATGGCAATDCSAYQTRVELARTECVPTPRARFTEWVWQERDVIENANQHARDPYARYIEPGHVEYGEPRLMRGRRPPCGSGGSVASEWSATIDQPVCVEPHDQLSPEGPWLSKESAPVVLTAYREVLHLLSCSRSVPFVSPVQRPGPEPEPITTSASRCGASRRVHQNVKAGVVLGDETFQLRAVVLGERPSTRQRDIMSAAMLRDRSTNLPWAGADIGDGLQQASRLFVAQAEYYFDADVTSGKGRDRLEWMWTMDWRARLVRFRVPDESSAPVGRDEDRCGVTPPTVDVTSACELAQGGAVCAGVESSLNRLSDLILH